MPHQQTSLELHLPRPLNEKLLQLNASLVVPNPYRPWLRVLRKVRKPLLPLRHANHLGGLLLRRRRRIHLTTRM